MFFREFSESSSVKRGKPPYLPTLFFALAPPLALN